MEKFSISVRFSILYKQIVLYIKKINIAFCQRFKVYIKRRNVFHNKYYHDLN